MTNAEKTIAEALGKCRFLPGSFDKRFVNQLPNWIDREMTKAGRTTLYRLYEKYRKQIPDYNPNLLTCNQNTNPVI
jgi:hypothetical protein